MSLGAWQWLALCPDKCYMGLFLILCEETNTGHLLVILSCLHGDDLWI